MSLLLYGIVAEHTLPAGFDASLTLIQANGLSAVTANSEETDQAVESILAFGNVVERIHQRTTVIPIRYGTLLANRDEVIKHLTEKAGHYRQRLAELEDCEEMGVRLPMATPEPDILSAKNAVSGRDYLLALKHKYSATEQAEKEAAKLDLALKGLFRKRCGEAGLFAGQHTYLISYLVPRAQLDIFRATLEELIGTHAPQGHVSGPWPPYNFAG